MRLGDIRLSIRLNKLTGLVLLCLAFLTSGLVAQENKFSLSSYGDELSNGPDKFFYFNELEGVLFLNGTIEKGIYTNFRQAITENKIHTIVLNSLGGNVEEGLNIAGTVFDKGIKTYIPKGYKCYSACSFIFLAGSEKYALGELGVHQAAYADDVSKEKAAIGAVTTVSQLTTADILLRLGEFNTPRFVEQRMLRTAPEDMYVFNAKELNKLGNLDVSNNSKALFKNIDKFIYDLQKYYAEQDCDNDVKKCTSTQLCKRAAANKSWNTTTISTKYVTEAKRKGLSCGVPVPVCPEDIKKCNQEYLCTYGTTSINTGLSWLNNSFADEAKLRDLSCNVKETKTSVVTSNAPQVVNGNLSGTWDILYSLCTDQRYEAVLKLSQDTKITKNEYYATYNAPHGYYIGTAQDNNGNFVNIPIENSDNFNNFSYSNIMLYSIPTSNNYFYYFICQDNFNNLYLSELTLDISTNSVSRTNTSYNNNGVNNIYNMPNSITSFLNNLYYVRTDLGYSSQQISNLNDSSKYPVYGISNTNPANQQGPTPASSSFVYYLEKNGTLTNYLSFILETPYIPTSNNYNDLSLGLISGSNYIGDNDNLPFKLIISSKDKPGFIYFSNNGGGACFIKDTEITILENNKEINKEVQYLKKGDLVKINENEYKKIVFIGENYYNILDKLNNIRIIKKDTISEHIPFKDTILTSGHSVLFENLDHINEYYNENIYTDNINGFKKMMTQHCKLFNFASLEDIKFLIKGNKIQYYHLALENDDIHGQYAIYTNNIRSESMAISHISISGLREINISPINNKLENLNNNIIKV